MGPRPCDNAGPPEKGASSWPRSASGLVRTQKLGRTRTCRLNPVTLRSAERWISQRRTFVERHLDRLGQYLAETAPNQEETT